MKVEIVISVDDEPLHEEHPAVQAALKTVKRALNDIEVDKREKVEQFRRSIALMAYVIHGRLYPELPRNFIQFTKEKQQSITMANVFIDKWLEVEPAAEYWLQNEQRGDSMITNHGWPHFPHIRHQGPFVAIFNCALKGGKERGEKYKENVYAINCVVPRTLRIPRWSL